MTVLGSAAPCHEKRTSVLASVAGATIVIQGAGWAVLARFMTTQTSVDAEHTKMTNAGQDRAGCPVPDAARGRTRANSIQLTASDCGLDARGLDPPLVSGLPRKMPPLIRRPTLPCRSPATPASIACRPRVFTGFWPIARLVFCYSPTIDMWHSIPSGHGRRCILHEEAYVRLTAWFELVSEMRGIVRGNATRTIRRAMSIYQEQKMLPSARHRHPRLSRHHEARG